MPPVFLFNLSVLQEFRDLRFTTSQNNVICLKTQYTRIKPSIQIHIHYSNHVFQLLTSHEQKPLTNNVVKIRTKSILEEAEGPELEDRPMTV